MTARKARRRPKARKEKLFEIEGHKLSPELEREWRRAVEARERQRRPEDASFDWAGRLGLCDFLWKYRPTKKAENQISALYQRMFTSNLVLANLQKYPFWSGDGASRTAGCRLLRTLAGEYYRTAHLLRCIAKGMEAESSTKLQDWLVFDSRLAALEENLDPSSNAEMHS